MTMFKKAYGGRVRQVLDCSEGNRTKASFAPECDINKIMARYEATGLVEHVRDGAPFYGDFQNIPDFAEALRFVQTSEDFFDQLPSKVRRRFDNDVGEFLAFMSNPDNQAEAAELGLIRTDLSSARGTSGERGGDEPREEGASAPETNAPAGNGPSA